MSATTSALADKAAAVILAYGDSPFLQGCVDSLLAQTQPVRIVIATSTPSSFIERIAAAQGVEVLINRQRTGIAGDWNFGLRATDARFVTLAHQDDWYHPSFCQETLKAFEREPGALLTFTGYQEIDDAGVAKSSKVSRAKHLIEGVTLGHARRATGLRLRAYLSFGNPLPCSSVTLDREKIPEFEFASDYASNLDWEAWLRLSANGAVFARAPGRLVGRRHNPLCATAGLIKDGRRQAEDLSMFRRLWPKPFGDVIAALYRTGY